MNVLQKEFELKADVKKSNFTDDQEYYMAILESINDKGEDVYNELSPEGQSWFNDNVDLVSEEKDLKGFGEFSVEIPQEITKEVEFGEDTDDTVKSECNTKNEEHGVNINEIKEGFLVSISTSNGNIEGTVSKVLKAAIKVEVDGKEVRISNRKIEKIIIISDSPNDENDIENEAPLSDEIDIENEAPLSDEIDEPVDKDSMDTINSSEDTINKLNDIELKQNIKSVKTDEEGVIEKIDVQTLKKEQKTCCKSNKNSNVKQILFHVAEIIRLASEEM